VQEPENSVLWSVTIDTAPPPEWSQELSAFFSNDTCDPNATVPQFKFIRKRNPLLLVRKQSIPTERPPRVGEC
jgi:hypothetical protein